MQFFIHSRKTRTTDALASSACSMSLIVRKIVLTGGPSHLSEHHSSSASRIPKRWGWIHPSSSFGVNTSALTWLLVVSKEGRKRKKHHVFHCGSFEFVDG
ncbi:hypothetical protein CEXT_446451 [Caerostris extrusa]|uniref:Uncharacterized protein n=1 Tax=Caerostris extrusa TaxID=172846 RepID=A0AAV4YD51_CAEEX|nr:hypothetical protein CEXT_446451 [Caerostris extrusa]